MKIILGYVNIMYKQDKIGNCKVPLWLFLRNLWWNGNCSDSSCWDLRMVLLLILEFSIWEKPAYIIQFFCVLFRDQLSCKQVQAPPSWNVLLARLNFLRRSICQCRVSSGKWGEAHFFCTAISMLLIWCPIKSVTALV